MIAAHSVDDVRRAERAAMARLPEGTLMQRAAAALDVECAHALRRTTGGVAGRSVVVLAGSGDNGGDALFAAARLARRGVAVAALTTSERVREDAVAAARTAGVRVRPWRAGDETVCAAADAVLDGIAGIGGGGGLRPAVAHLPDVLAPDRAERPVVLAVDLPSGLDADSAAVAGPVLTADVTVTFGTAKPAHLLGPAAGRCGRLVVVDIGITGDLPRPALERVELADVAARWRRARPGDDKYSRGVVGVVAGGPDYTGAAVLAVEAAVRAGAGMVRYLGPDHPAEIVRLRRPEAVAGPGRVQAWVLGPGVSPDDPEQQARIRDALASGEPAVVDAGALGGLPDTLGPQHVLTPHAGELARLLGALGQSTERADVAADPLTAARRVREATGATVLLKGSVTTVVGGGRVLTAATAPAWLSTAGAGDVLAGILGAALAGRPDDDPAQVAADAAALHGWAAALASAGGPLSALDVADAVPAALTSLPGWSG